MEKQDNTINTNNTTSTEEPKTNVVIEEKIVCGNPNCDKPGKLRCPNCKKYSIKENSYFCGKECFTGCWKEHKKLHEDFEPIDDGFPYTGKLRRYKVTPQVKVPDNILKPDYAEVSEGTSKCEENEDPKKIPVYNEEDIKYMKEVCKIGRKIIDIAHKAVKPGVTTDYIDKVVHEACMKYEVYPSPLNYYKFPKSVCTSINEIICHGIPDMRLLEEGDIINIDISVYKNGYHADLNETYIVGGKTDEDSKYLVKSAYECLDLAIKACKPGVMYKEIGNIIGDFIAKKGLSVVKTYCGHGIGKLFHCNPNVPHYKKNKTVGIMRPGHIFTIEPMINQGTWRDVTWFDDWTSSTEDGKRSAQFEHTLLITEDGVEILTAREEDSPKLEFMD